MPPPPPGSVGQFVEQHLRSHPGLVSVCSTPNGVSSYLVEGDGVDTVVKSVRFEQGRLVTRSATEAFGDMIAIVGGASVIEVCLHQSLEQRQAYRETVAAVDAENREQTLSAIQAAAVAVIREVGVAIEETSEGS